MQQAVTAGIAQQRLRSSARAFQRRVHRHYLLAWILRGVALGSTVGLALVLAAMWESQEPTWLKAHLVAPGLALLVALLAVVTRPSLSRAARLMDDALQLEERVSTALEIMDGRLRTLMAGRQLDDALQAVESQPASPVFHGQLRGRARTAGVTLALFVASFVLGSVVDPASNPVATARSAAEEALSQPSFLSDAFSKLPLFGQAEEDPFEMMAIRPLLDTYTDEELRQQLARSRSQQAALSRLAQALSGTAAAREVGEQLQRGNYAEAASRLRELARYNDQLSPEAKAELAEALRQAAEDSASLSPELAQLAERAAANLSSRNYRAAQRALEQLVQGITEAGQEVVPQEELAEAWRRMQHDLIEDDEYAMFDGGDGAFTGSFQLGEGAMWDDDYWDEDDEYYDGPFDLSGAAAGGAGSGSGLFDPDGISTRLNVAGSELTIDGRATGAGDGRGAGDGAPPISIREGEELGAFLEGIQQPTDPVRDVIERTSIPLGHLQAVHDYFQVRERPQ